MRNAITALILFASPAAAGGSVQHTAAEYLAAYGKARTYALAHMNQAVQPSCRKTIGKRPARVVEQRCLDVSASRRTACEAADQCAALLDKLDHYCTSWKGDIACVYPDEGGEVVLDWTKRGSWKSKEP
ncbi:hypothetical protein G3T14_19260 [Methylobacterium sp. BTF04]|uniref:hypothetical protein n=1 Tax=Methylobacterium sp. BTF04 TaxID=2708300 RepID=UPI0013D156B5|nr:hypothetical protein [Methylobacterium sp. BTF04]NEU14249.1 hypothetical protein [Methylobacterium sp. BTF04]